MTGRVFASDPRDVCVNCTNYSNSSTKRRCKCDVHICPVLYIERHCERQCGSSVAPARRREEFEMLSNPSKSRQGGERNPRHLPPHHGVRCRHPSKIRQGGERNPRHLPIHHEVRSRYPQRFACSTEPPSNPSRSAFSISAGTCMRTWLRRAAPECLAALENG